MIRESIALRLRNQRLVDELTLARDQADRARDQAEQAHEAKNRFLAAASHDIRQPLHAAQLFVGALAHDARSRELPVMARLRAALDAARQMLDTLLDVSMLDAGVVQRRDTVFAARAVGQPLIEMFEPVAARRASRSVCAARPRCGCTDPALLQRVLVNLVGNAVKFTERGAVLISFRRRGASALVQVWDTGIGIAARDLATIFEEFTQLGNPQRDRTRGTGLGLTIVRRLCRLLNPRSRCARRQGAAACSASAADAPSPDAPHAVPPRRCRRHAPACWWSTTTCWCARPWRRC